MTRVLLIDDSPLICKLHRLVLERAGYTIYDEAADGQAGLAKLRASRYPLIVVMGNVMPIMYGLAMLEIVATDPVLSARHVYIMVTASDVQDAPVLSTLNVPYLAKPIKITPFLALVRQASLRLPPEN